MLIIWLGLLGILFWYTQQIIVQYIQAVESPSSTVTITEVPNAPLPRVIVCNWNQNGSPQDPMPTGACPECELTLISCTNINTSANCSDLWFHSPYQTEAGYFDCYTFNSDPNNNIISATTGYSGGYATVWKVLKPNATDPPTSRAGVQASFLLNDGSIVNETTIYNEYRFVAIGQDNFFALQVLSTINTQLPTTDPNYNTTVYSTIEPAVTLLTDPANPAYAYMGVSFAFQTLSTQITTFSIGYTLTNMFGDFANMIGTTHGLDAIKTCAGLPVIFLGIKFRTINEMADHFNGG